MLSTLPPPLKARTRALNRRRVAKEGRGYVLCWLQQALRATDNPALDVAVTVANRLGLPVVVHHGIREDYPYASDRLHRFLIGASRTLEKGCEARGIRCVNLLLRPAKFDRSAVYRLAADAALTVTDDQPLFVARRQADRFAAKADGAVWAVDANHMVPLGTLAEGITSTKGFRAAHKPLRDRDWAVPGDVAPEQPPHDGPLAYESDRLAARRAGTLDRWLAECRIDHSLPPGAFEASAAALEARMAALEQVVLPAYRWRRNNAADPAGASRLSPYLHFGMIGPREVARRVAASDAPAGCKWKFLDEMLTWREWFAYLAWHRETPTAWSILPERARATLEAHSGDPRDHLPGLAALMRGETGDETWDAAQKGFVCDGYMHNNLRMFWGKKLIEWTASPKEAWSTALWLNDRLSYDGRDPATYGNMEWVFGRGRPGYREIPVYGRVSPKSDRAMRRRPGMADWLATEAAREAPAASVPNAVPDYAGEAPPYFPMLFEG